MAIQAVVRRSRLIEKPENIVQLCTDFRWLALIASLEFRGWLKAKRRHILLVQILDQVFNGLIHLSQPQPGLFIGTRFHFLPIGCPIVGLGKSE